MDQVGSKSRLITDIAFSGSSTMSKRHCSLPPHSTYERELRQNLTPEWMLHSQYLNLSMPMSVDSSYSSMSICSQFSEALCPFSSQSQREPHYLVGAITQDAAKDKASANAKTQTEPACPAGTQTEPTCTAELKDSDVKTPTGTPTNNSNMSANAYFRSKNFPPMALNPSSSSSQGTSETNK